MSKPKEKKNVKEVIVKKRNLSEGDPIPPFDSTDNDKIGDVYSKERT